MKNWLKHQSLNPNMKTGISRVMESLPEWLQEDLATDKQQSLLDVEK